MQHNANSSGCANCVFVKYKNKAQTGCKAGKLENFHEKQLVKSSNGRIFYIGQPVCTFYRDKRWKHSKKSIKSMMGTARKEIQIKIVAYITNNLNNFDNVLKTIESLQSQKLKPSKIIIIQNSGNGVQPDFIGESKSIFKIPWEIKFLQGEHNRDDITDWVISKQKDKIMLFFDAGWMASSDLLSNIDRAIHDKRQEFMFLNRDENNQGLLFFKAAYDHLFPMTVNDILSNYKNSQPNITEFGKIWQ